MIRPTLITLAICVAVWSMNPSAQSQETANANKHQQTAQTSPKASSVPIATPTTQISKPTASQDTRNADDHLDRDWFDWYTAFGPATWSNWILAAFAVVAAIIGLRTISGIRDQNRAAAIALRLNRAATNAARRSADAAEQALVDLERPWIFVEPAGWNGSAISFDRIEVITPFSLGYRIQNYGRTPAFVTTGSVWLRVIPRPLPDAPPYPDTPQYVVPVPIPPSRILNNAVSALISPDEQMAIIRQEADLVFFGFIGYRDVFGKDHESRWCAVYRIAVFRLAGDPAASWAFEGPPSWTNYT